MKSQKYLEWNYNNSYNTLDQRWFDMKKIGSLCNWNGFAQICFALDSLHSLACFWAYEYVLWRLHPKYQIDSFVFQDLHSQKENRVSTMTTKAIRHHLSKDVSNHKKDAFSSKYLCISSITKMEAHQGDGFNTEIF